MKSHCFILIIIITILIGCKKEDEINCYYAGCGNIISIKDTILGYFPNYDDIAFQFIYV